MITHIWNPICSLDTRIWSKTYNKLSLVHTVGTYGSRGHHFSAIFNGCIYGKQNGLIRKVSQTMCYNLIISFIIYKYAHLFRKQIYIKCITPSFITGIDNGGLLIHKLQQTFNLTFLHNYGFRCCQFFGVDFFFKVSTCLFERLYECSILLKIQFAVFTKGFR